MTIARYLVPLALAASLAACQVRTDESEDPEPGARADESGEETAEPPEPRASESPQAVSILRPDIAPPEMPEVPLEPLEVTIRFPEGGMELDEAAVDALERVLASEQAETGAPIVLRSHTDSEGSDKGNLKASEKRGALVKDWLTERDIDPDRITVIAFGEQNPVAPNALPDGSPNPRGRARNRRVEVAVVPVPEETIADDGGTQAGGGTER